jgi:hypothetical protein
MAIGVIWYPPIDQQTYDAVREKVTQASVDKGLTFHAGGEAEGVVANHRVLGFARGP